MRTITPASASKSSSGYTLVEALVASVLLMMGISAASALTLTLLTQDEMNQRHGVALAEAELIAQLYHLGLDELEIRQVVPSSTVVETFTLTPGSESVPGVGTLPSASISVQFNPSPATESWAGQVWTAGRKTDSRTIEIQAYRSSLP